MASKPSFRSSTPTKSNRLGASSFASVSAPAFSFFDYFLFLSMDAAFPDCTDFKALASHELFGDGFLSISTF